MTAAMADPIRIYVALLDESVEVWRPVDATHVDADSYRILGVNEAPEDERWEFEEGTLVRCRARSFADGSAGLVAFEKVPK